MGNDITEFSKLYQKNPQKILIEQKELTVSNIKQYYLEMDSRMKKEILNRLFGIYNPKLAIVFCNTKRMVDQLVTDLTKMGYNVDALHGDMKQSQRDNVMKRFRASTIDILIATDIAARGLDVENVDLVVNYDLPQQNDYYVHRIGRTARAGKKGISFTFVTNRDYNRLRDIERHTKSKMEKMELPTIFDVKVNSSKQLKDQIIKNLKNKENLEIYTELLNEILSEGHSLFDVSLGLIKMIDNNKNNKSHEELNNVDFGKKFEISKPRTNSKGKTKIRKIKGPKMFVNKGSRDGVDTDVMIKAIKKYTKIPVSDIGDINIMPNFSFVEIPIDMLRGAIKDLDGKKIAGKVMKAEYSDK